MGFFLSPVVIGIWLTLALAIGIGLVWCARKQRKADRAWSAMFSNEQGDQFD